MFLVLNKEKICSYCIAVLTVAVLFFASTIFTQEVVQTATIPQRKIPIYRVQTEEKKIALTMNCAWNADDIDKILEILERQQVKITFFMVGDWVKKYPEAVKKIADAGHEIGNHSDTHPHVNQLTLEKNREEIKKCAEKIKEITGKSPTLYRGPYGEYNDTVITAAENEQNKVIQWSLDTLDYSGITGNEMWNRLNGKLTNGDIILMHNGTKHTADSLEMIIQNIKQKGYKIAKVSDMIYQDNYIIQSDGSQKQNS